MATKTSWEHDGYKITLTEGGCFSVKIEEEEENFRSIDEAREAIKKAISVARRSKSVKLNLLAVAADGRECIVVGVHAGNGKVMTSPNVHEDYNERAVYVRHPAVTALLAKKAELEAETKHVEKKLDGLEVRWTRDYHGRIDAGQHARAVEKLKAVHKKALELAEGLTT